MTSEFENEQIESGAENETPSPEVSDSESVQESDEGTTPESKQTTAKETDLPFHEHPRFKELVEQKNQEKSRAEALEQRYAQMEQRLQQMMAQNAPKPEVNPMIAKLQGIDPEFADYIQGLESKTAKLEALETWKEQFETNQVKAQAINHVNSLHEKNKLAPEDREIYNNLLDASYMRGEIRNIKDIDAYYTKIHDQFSKRMEAMKRSERESYSKEKKVDSKVPTSQPAGKAPAQGKKPDWSKDPHEARAQLIRRTLNLAKQNDSL